MMRHRANQNRGGFTLVELLVVVSIIALLISILLPSLRSARTQAKKVVCATRLKQVSNALWSYWTEANGRVPFIETPMTNGGDAGPRGSIPGFGQDNVLDDEIDPFNRLATASGSSKQGWPTSLANTLMPRYLGQMEQVFVCPSALVGWPKKGGPYRMTYRPAAANQLKGGLPDPTRIAAPFDYLIEHFGFMDGRVYKSPAPVRKSGDDRTSMIGDALKRTVLRGTFVRDTVKVDGAGTIGPHSGGINVINKRFDVEYKNKKTMMADLDPAQQTSVKF
jgi:prepilin-type N-terminal cleavage/methylation domain-containing protein